MQRQLAIQRLQEQEKERQMRLEQQKHTIQMRAQMPAFSLPYAQVHALIHILETNPTAQKVVLVKLLQLTADRGCLLLTQMQSLPPSVAGGVVYQPGPPPSYPGTFSPAGSVEGSPMHNIYMNQPGQTATPQYQAMPGAATGEEFSYNHHDNHSTEMLTSVHYFFDFIPAIFLQIQTWSMRTCIRRRATMDRLRLLRLLRLLPILVPHTPTTNPHPHRVIRSDLTA